MLRGLMDLGIILLKPKPDAPTESSIAYIITKFEKLKRKIWLSLMLIKRSASVTIRGSILEQRSAKNFLDADRREVLGIK